MTATPEQAPQSTTTQVVLAGAVIVLYTDAETDLIAGMAAIARQGGPDMLGRMRSLSARIAVDVQAEAGPLVRQMAAQAAQAGSADAVAELTAVLQEAGPLVQQLIAQSVAAESIAAQTEMAAVADTEATGQVLVSASVGAPVTAHAGSNDVASAPKAAIGTSDPLDALPSTTPTGVMNHGELSARMIAQDLESKLANTSLRITRFADDAYRAATAAAATEQVLGATPQEAQAMAWRQLMARGVTGFVDKAGKNWNLSTYVEMATRTAAMRAYNASHQARLTAMGVTYFTVSDTARPCPLCLPWQGRVLSEGGESDVTTWAADRDEHVTFKVSATVEEAMAAGLFHPNCEHTLVAYLPGVTVLRTVPQWTDGHERRYQDTQRLRALERAVRSAKHEALGALTDLDRKRAERMARAGQARIRAHIAQTGLMRRPRREQVNLGNT